jgi:transcriptional regulator with XRE-family HTH domain
MPIGEEIRRMRNQKRVTMPQISEAIGAPASAIYLWEKNRLVPDAWEIEALARFFGVPVSALTGAPAPVAEAEISDRPDRPERTRPHMASAPDAARAPESGRGLDMILVTRIYHSIRDKAENASLVELATVRDLLLESLKIVETRIREYNESDEGGAKMTSDSRGALP